jgi:YVTN family beta-propeller protein
VGKFRKAIAAAIMAAGLTNIGGAHALEKPAATVDAAQIGKSSKVATDRTKRIVRDGVAVDFEAIPVEGSELMEGVLTEVRFRVTDEATGKPVAGSRMGAWMDVGANIQGQAGAVQKQCVEKIGLYLKGAVGIRPLVDLNGYYLLVMNKDASITVIDPMVSMAGRTSTMTTVQLKAAAMDWINHGAFRRLYVSMPAAGQIALVNTETFKAERNIDAGEAPTRIVLQPDGRYLWVGNNGRDAQSSGITVIDTREMKVVLQAPTGRGHHEIAISSDNKLAFVTNRDDNTVTVFDIATLKKIKDVPTGQLPLSVAYSSLSRAAYVSNGKAGSITVIDAGKLEVVKTIAAKPGLGPLRFTPDGRFAMVVNTAEGVVHVIDPGSNEIIHSPKVQPEPFQISYTTGFAYVRSLGSERVSMINLSSLGQGKEPIVQSFAAGSYAPKMGGDLPLADAVVGGLGEAAAFVVSPADNTTYFYMEGMNAPMSSYPSRGKYARAVTVIDRSLKEIEPGVLAGRFRMPVAGHFDVAMSLDQPPMVHCFSTDAKPNPTLEAARRIVEVEFLPQGRIFRPGETATLRFRVIEAAGAPKAKLKDVMVRSFMAPASTPSDQVARELGDGIYEAKIPLPDTGAYYVYVGIPSLQLGFSDSGFITLMARGEPLPGATAQAVPPPAAAAAKPAPAKAKKKN